MTRQRFFASYSTEGNDVIVDRERAVGYIVPGNRVDRHLVRLNKHPTEDPTFFAPSTLKYLGLQSVLFSRFVGTRYKGNAGVYDRHEHRFYPVMGGRDVLAALAWLRSGCQLFDQPLAEADVLA